MDTNSTLHQCLLKGLAPTADRCVRILSARQWVLHCHLFVNRHVKENSSVATDHLLEPGINPMVHIVAWICRAVERDVNHLSWHSSVLLVLKPCSHICWERRWAEWHSQHSCRSRRCSRHCNSRCRCRSDSRSLCICNCCRNVNGCWGCWTRCRSRCSRSWRSCWDWRWTKTGCRIRNVGSPLHLGSLIQAESAMLECRQ